jgi:hypothetical protein
VMNCAAGAPVPGRPDIPPLMSVDFGVRVCLREGADLVKPRGRRHRMSLKVVTPRGRRHIFRESPLLLLLFVVVPTIFQNTLRQPPGCLQMSTTSSES